MMNQLTKASLALLIIASLSPAIHGLRCVTCDSASDPGCGYAQNETLAVVTECEAQVTHCFVAVVDEPTKRVTRGCHDASITSCSETNCERCTTDECNDFQFIEESCISCESSSLNTFCEWNVVDNNEPVICPHTSYDRSGCYLKIVDNVYTRDCVANLDDDDLADCKAGEGDCKICQGDNCNSKEEFQRCYTCDSEKDENCVYRPDGAYIKRCAKYDDTCVQFVFAAPLGGKTARGCAHEVDTGSTFCPGSSNCDECTGVDCNSGLVPEYRILCYQCTDDQFGCVHDQTMFKSYERACRKFNFEDKCYTYLDETNKFHRGCLSDDSPASIFCNANPELCDICSGKSCNSQILVKPPTLSCYRCADASCLFEVGPPTAKCEVQVVGDQEESCYYTKTLSGTVRMGCTLDDAHTCSTTECLTCSGDNCNAEYAPKKSELICHQCSDTDEKCKWRQTELEEPVYCQSMVLHGETESCYYYRYENGDTRRGCLKDDAVFCYGHDCKTCTGNYCNSVAETQSCIQCNSTQSQFETCAKDANGLNAMVCPEEAFLEDVGCYSVKLDDDVVIRGCWNTAPEEHKNFCAEDWKGDKERCVKCTGVGCNKKDHSGSATLIVALPLVLLSGFITLWTQ